MSVTAKITAATSKIPAAPKAPAKVAPKAPALNTPKQAPLALNIPKAPAKVQPIAKLPKAPKAVPVAEVKAPKAPKTTSVAEAPAKVKLTAKEKIDEVKSKLATRIEDVISARDIKIETMTTRMNEAKASGNSALAANLKIKIGDAKENAKTRIADLKDKAAARIEELKLLVTKEREDKRAAKATKADKPAKPAKSTAGIYTATIVVKGPAGRNKVIASDIEAGDIRTATLKALASLNSSIRATKA